MLRKLEKAQEKWGGSHQAIDRWLEERQDLLVIFCRLTGTAPFDKKALPDSKQIQDFCDILVDYVSAGHFEIYENVVARCEEHGPQSLDLARRLYPRITACTQRALEFNDTYGEGVPEDKWEAFDEELSRLGEELAVRFEMEDKLIETLYQRHLEPQREEKEEVS